MKGKFKTIFRVALALVLILSFTSLPALPVAANAETEETLTVTGPGDAEVFTLAEMDQHFSTEVIDASAGSTTLSGEVTLGNFEAGNGNDVWYEIGLVSSETYLGYPRLHNKGVYMIALWTPDYYKVHMQNVAGYENPPLVGSYLGDEEPYTNTWGDAGLCYFKVPQATFRYEIVYHDVEADNGLFDMRISTDAGTTWSSWKYWQYAEDDEQTQYEMTEEEIAAYGYANDDDLTNARVVSQLFVESETTETFTATYDNIQVNGGDPYTLKPRVYNSTQDKSYAGIQAAIDNASLGDSIYVGPGVYDGVIVDEGVVVAGEPDGSSVIISGVPYKEGNDSHNSAFRPEADGAEIRNFTVECDVEEGFDLGVYAVEVDSIIVDSLTINSDGTVQGITNWGGSGWTITNNVITSTVASGGGGIGIYLGAKAQQQCNLNLVQYNQVNATATAETYSCPGICLAFDTRYGQYALIDGSESLIGNQILDNVITASGANNGVGIEVGSILGNNEEDPDRTDPEKIAALMEAGALAENTVMGNTISGACEGIYIYNATGTEIIDNEISDSVNNGIYAEYAQSGTEISGNTFTNNWVQVWDDTVTLDINSTLEANTYDRAVTVDHPGDSLLPVIWSSLQQAIDAATDGDTVAAGPGHYVEDILIEKPITVLGATSDVNKNGYEVPTGYAWDESIESIITHPAPGSGYNAIVDIYDVSDVIFKGFIVQELHAQGSTDDSLLRVRAQSQQLSGIDVSNNVIGPFTNIEGQNGAQGRMGLYLVNNPYSDQYGIVDSIFAGNKIFGCEGNGDNIFIWSSYSNPSYGAPGPASMAGTVIEDNEIYGAHRSGIETAGGYSGLTIRNNKIYGNSGSASDAPPLKYGNGIVLIRGSGDSHLEDNPGLGPEDLTIEGNEIYDNEKNGIYMGPVNKNYTITDNDIHDNGWDGVRVDLTARYHNPDFEEGDRIPWANKSQNVAVTRNNITASGQYGARVIGTPTNGFRLDASDNWWGGADGPGGAGPGTANAVSNTVKYRPWLPVPKDETAEVTEEKEEDYGQKKEEFEGTDTTVDTSGTEGSGDITVTSTNYDPPEDTGGTTLQTGTGKQALKYVDVKIEDNTYVGNIRITISYTDEDLDRMGINEYDLSLYYYDMDIDEWVEADNISIDMDHNTISGDIPADKFAGLPIACGGDPLTAIENLDTHMFYMTIQEAEDDAEPGQTIALDDGTYNVFGGETFPVVVDVPGLSIISLDGPVATIIQPSSEDASAFEVRASGVTIGGDDCGFTINSGGIAGIYADEAGGEGIKVQGNIFVSYADGESRAMVFEKLWGDALIDQNTFIEPRVGTAILIQNADGAAITQNNVPPDSVKYSFVTLKAEAFYPERNPDMPFAEYVAETPSTINDLLIQNNNLNDMHWAIRFATSIKPSDHGEPQAQDLTIGSGGVQILGNPIVGNDTGVQIDMNEPSDDDPEQIAHIIGVQNIQIHGNAFRDSEAAINNEQEAAVNAQGNWWNDVAGPDIDSNPYHDWTNGEWISENVNYLPWMIQLELDTGWNIVSFPIMGAQTAEADIPEQIIAAYYFDSETQLWGANPFDSGPMDAIYIKTTAPVAIGYVINDEATFPSQKQMKVGWNFIGLNQLYSMDLDEALFDIYWGTGDVPVGYSKVISPSLNGESWTYVTDAGDIPLLRPTKGYWVFMVNDGVLGGFTTTPIVPVPGP